MVCDTEPQAIPCKNSRFESAPIVVRFDLKFGSPPPFLSGSLQGGNREGQANAGCEAVGRPDLIFLNHDCLWPIFFRSEEMMMQQAASETAAARGAPASAADGGAAVAASAEVAEGVEEEQPVEEDEVTED